MMFQTHLVAKEGIGGTDYRRWPTHKSVYSLKSDDGFHYKRCLLEGVTKGYPDVVSVEYRLPAPFKPIVIRDPTFDLSYKN